MSWMIQHSMLSKWIGCLCRCCKGYKEQIQISSTGESFCADLDTQEHPTRACKDDHYAAVRRVCL